MFHPRSELMALLADVKENPADLTPWLVLCDWLEESGDDSDRARAEYCRLCFDKLGKKTGVSDWEMGERRRELMRRYKEKWLGPLATLQSVPYGPPVVQMRRGLVQLTIHPPILTAMGDSMPVEIWAWVETLNIFAPGSDWLTRLANWPLLRGPTTVSILHTDYSHYPQPEDIEALAQSPYLDRIRCFRFRTSSSYSFTLGGPTFDWLPRLAPLQERFGDRLQLT